MSRIGWVGGLGANNNLANSPGIHCFKKKKKRKKQDDGGGAETVERVV